MSELLSDPEREAKRELFVANLGSFIIEASHNSWAADATKVRNSQRPGFKELTYASEEWSYRDSYSGYYMAPGSSVVYLKGRPVWYMTYGGDGQSSEHFDKAKQTYAFLRRALMEPEPELPIRGPLEYQESEQFYNFEYDGDLINARWSETIHENDNLTFSQRGDVSIIVDKASDRSPIYPWDI